MTPDQAATLIENNTAAQIFGTDSSKFKGTYRELVLLCHPDRKKLEPARAEKVLQRLTMLYAEFTGKKDPAPPVVIGKWVIAAPLTAGDVCDLYSVESADAPGVLKIARSPKDNDLVQAEEAALKTLHADKRSGNFKRYYPALLDSFEASRRRANVITSADGFTSLPDLVALFPGGLDFRHGVWIMNRLLSALGAAHKNGIVHGAVMGRHILCSADHAIKLVDWCYSVKPGDRLKAIPAGTQDSYPPEVIRKNPSQIQTDIFMAAKAIMDAFPTYPRSFGPVFKWMLTESWRSRPESAWHAQDSWVSAAELEFGPAKFVPLAVPKV